MQQAHVTTDEFEQAEDGYACNAYSDYYCANNSYQQSYANAASYLRDSAHVLQVSVLTVTARVT